MGKRFLASVLTVLPLCGVAAEIEWATATPTLDKSQLIGGSVVLAVNGGPDVTVTQAGPDAATYHFSGASYADLEFAPAGGNRTFGSAGGASSGDDGFDTLLGSFAYADGNIRNGTQTISGLIPGATYQVQLFFNDQRAGLKGRKMTFGDETNDVTIGAAGVGRGEHVIGTFVADATTQSITHRSNGFKNVHFNALLVTTQEAGQITWGPSRDTTDKSQLIGGKVVLAINGGNPATIPEGGPAGAQTYAFQGGGYAGLDTSPGVPSKNYFASGGRVSSGDTDFDSLLGSFTYTTNGRKTLAHTIHGLESGKAYRIQLFYNDQRPGKKSRAMLFGDGTGEDVEISANGQGWGQHVVGSFVAAGESQNIRHTVKAAKNLHLTAFLVTEIETGPTARLYGDKVATREEFRIYPSFDAPVRGLTTEDFVINGAAIVGLDGEGRHYKLDLRATGTQDIAIKLRAGAAVSMANGERSRASETMQIKNAIPSGTFYTFASESEWAEVTQNTSGAIVADGVLAATEETGTFTSDMIPFGAAAQPKAITLSQTADWDNWTARSNIGPSAARDAPVLLPMGDGRYYFLALGSTGGYHAWFSSDMESWVHRGPVTPRGAGRWVTSAEVKDGMVFIYSDVPNDQNPTVFIDENLDDGIPGVPGGTALEKAACGSDSGFIRNDGDDLFHVIYEDWSPINARLHSWDSPLAGHASSPDGINGFVYDEHPPAVDFRSEPTGVTTTYSHPYIGTCSFDVHSPEQDAFGDWTAIKIGQQFYLFGDYDQHEGGINVGRLTSTSLFEPFEFVGSFGNGHPDPTVAFAEGQFYLATQQGTDYVSPGPWVGGVELRVGIDTNGNGNVNQWTPWQTVSESYARKAGYARVVETTPAQIDLSGLPMAQGMRFQIRLNGVGTVIPKIDKVEIRVE